jgi:hypothetical protein
MSKLQPSDDGQRPDQQVQPDQDVNAKATVPQLIMLVTLHLFWMIIGSVTRFRRSVTLIILVIILVIMLRVPMPAELPTLPPEYFNQVF